MRKSWPRFLKTYNRQLGLQIFTFGGSIFLFTWFTKIFSPSLNFLSSNAWDGSSHQALAEIHTASIFPDTFGWTYAVFSGMPCPNFYPPSQVWLAAMLYHLHLFSSGLAFKLAVLIPILLLPLAVWIATREITRRDTLVACGAVIISLFLLADSRFYLKFNSGIDLFSAFQLGLYAQSLGFVLLVLWLAVYLSNSQSWGRTALSAVALALTVLSNFFAAITAAFFVAATLLCDGWECWRAFGRDGFRPAVNRLFGHLSVVLVGVLLSLFWLAPMFSEYEYFVTRPNPVNLGRYFSPVLWGYCVVALIGAAIWRRNPSPGMWPYLGGCGLMALALFFSSTVAPEWFPLQAPRLLAILIFLLAIPAGHALAAALRQLARLLREFPGKDQAVSLKRAPYMTSIALVLLLVAGFTSPGTTFSSRTTPDRLTTA